MDKIKILLIENNTSIRNRILNILKPKNDLSIIAVSRDTKNPLPKIHQFNPDVVFLDKGLENQNSLGFIIELKRDFPLAKIIVMDTDSKQSDILNYLKAGASGFIFKDTLLNNFLINIRTVIDKSSILPPLLVDSLFSQIVNQAVTANRSTIKKTVKMTKQEQTIAALLSKGLSNKEIGETNNLSGIELKEAVENVLDKLVSSIIQKLFIILKLMDLFKEFPKVTGWSMINLSAKYNLSKVIQSPRRSNSFMILLPKNVTLFFYVSQSDKKLLTMQEFLGRKNNLLNAPEIIRTVKIVKKVSTHTTKDKKAVKLVKINAKNTKRIFY